MFPIFGIVRVSGWSREAGFFNSLIIIVALVYHYADKKVKKRKVQYILFLIAFIISFSKVSFLSIAIILVIKLKKYIDKIPFFIGIAIIILTGILTSEILLKTNQYDKAYSDSYITFAHRFGGYNVLKQINIEDILVGIDTIEELPQEIKDNNNFLENIYELKSFCGVPEMIINNGIFIAILFFVLLRTFNIKTVGLFIITIATLTVDYTTQTSFVVLAYYLALTCYEKKDNCKTGDTFNNEKRKNITN